MSRKIYLFLIVFVIGLGCRLYKLKSREIHFDEKASIGCSVGIPFAGIYQTRSSTWEELKINPDHFSSADFWKYNSIKNVYNSTLEDNGSILYFTTLHYWTNLFGTKIFTYRLYSAIFSLAVVIAIYFFTFELFGSWYVSFVAALLLALHPLHISSGQFTRSHSMACFFTCCATYFFFRLLRDKNYKNIFLYALFCTAAMLSHYFASYIILGHFIYMLAVERNKITWKYFIIAGTLSVSLFGIWMILGGLEGIRNLSEVNKQFQSYADHWKEGDNPYYTPFTLKTMIGGYIQVSLAITGNLFQELLNYSLSKLVVLTVLFWGTLAYIFFTMKSHLYRKEIYLLLILIAGYFIWATIISMRSNFIVYFQTGYSVYIVPYVCILIAYLSQVLYQSGKDKLLYCFIVLQALVWSVSFYLYYDINTSQKTPGVFYEVLAEKKLLEKDIITYPDWETAFMVDLSLRQHPEIVQRIK
ncbi:MAG TPA: glycosyltransferase family 39 protein [Cytophagaceae bacterium]|nr:glycosyltransferase family 39 protein [Cytophagaceae bacterium]